MLPLAFYQRKDVVQIAKDLLGKKLCTRIGGRLTTGIIVETEAYAGLYDKASHSSGGRRTKRTEPMFAEGGIAYVYLCYGIHHLFNIVTGEEGNPTAVLIRAIEPVHGVEIMLERRRMNALKPALTAGPGAAMMALGVTTALTKTSLSGPEIWVEEGIIIKDAQIAAGTRVGVAYAKEDAYLPYRFWIAGNPYVSKGKGL